LLHSSKNNWEICGTALSEIEEKGYPERIPEQNSQINASQFRKIKLLLSQK